MAKDDKRVRKRKTEINLLNQDRNDELQYEQRRKDYPCDEVDHTLLAR